MQDNNNNERTALLREQQHPNEQVVDIIESPTDIEPSKPKKDWKYWLIWFWRFCIFAMTGSCSIKVTKLVLTRLFHMNVQAWYYYVAFFFAELVVYTIMIMVIGSLLFQWRFFCLVAYRMWSWLLPCRVKTWCWNHLHSHTMSI